MIDWPFLHSLAENETFSTKAMDDLRAKLQTEIDALNAEHQRIQEKTQAYKAINPTRRNEGYHADYRQAQADRVKALQWEVTLRREASTILEHPDYLAIVTDERALSQAYIPDNGENWATAETAVREFKQLQQFLGA